MHKSIFNQLVFALDRVPSYVYMKDRDSRYIYANQLCLDLFECTLDQLKGRGDDSFFPEATVSQLRQVDLRVLSGESTHEEISVLGKDGRQYVYVEVKTPVYDYAIDQHPIAILGISTDISEQKRLEEAERIAHQQTTFANNELAAVVRLNEAILLNSPVAIGVYDDKGQCVQANGAYAELVGASREQLLQQNFKDIAAYHHSHLLQLSELAFSEHKAQQTELDVLSSFGKNVFCEVRMLPIELIGRKHLLLQFIDLSARKQLEEDLRQLAFYDVLTRLPNRRLLLDRLHQALSSRQRHHVQLAVLFIDLDRFKALNDTHGHEVGDLLLVEVAIRLKREVRTSDTVARLGGDEFVILLEMHGIEAYSAEKHASQVAEKIRHALAAPFQLGEIQHQSSASVGVRLVSNSDTHPDQILKDADAAMYQFKHLR